MALKLSYYQLSLVHNCPFMWKKARESGHGKGPKSKHLGTFRGALWHRVMEDWAKKHIDPIAGISLVFDEVLTQGFEIGWQDTREQVIEQTKAFVRRAIDVNNRYGLSHGYIESWFCVRIAGGVLRGRIDRICHSTHFGQDIVVDYKGKQGGADTKQLQLYMYATHRSPKLPSCSQAMFLYGAGPEKIHKYKGDDKVGAYIESGAKLIGAPIHKAKAGHQCSWCVYKASCIQDKENGLGRHQGTYPLGGF